jgi:hypothetical protein
VLLRTVAGQDEISPLPWTASWTDSSGQTVQSGLSAARLRGICAGSAPGVPGRAPRNPRRSWVRSPPAPHFLEKRSEYVRWLVRGRRQGEHTGGTPCQGVDRFVDRVTRSPDAERAGTARAWESTARHPVDTRQSSSPPPLTSSNRIIRPTPRGRVWLFARPAVGWTLLATLCTVAGREDAGALLWTGSWTEPSV